MAAKKGRRVGPRNAAYHGTINGYTNHKCRCQPCRDAFAAYVREYRANRFVGKKCSIKRCKRQASQAAGNGLCAHHHDKLQEKERSAA